MLRVMLEIQGGGVFLIFQTNFFRNVANGKDKHTERDNGIKLRGEELWRNWNFVSIPVDYENVI